MASKKTTVFNPINKRKLLKKLPYELKKVVDPHTHMTREVAGAFLECCRLMEIGQDSYVNWEVGNMYDPGYDEESEEYEEEHEEDECEDLEGYEEEEDNYTGSNWEKVDNWFLKNGWKKGDTVFTLCWW